MKSRIRTGLENGQEPSGYIVPQLQGIATQKDELRKRLDIAASATRLKNFFLASVELMKVLARACGHDHLNKFRFDDLSTYDEQIHKLTGIAWAGGADL